MKINLFYTGNDLNQPAWSLGEAIFCKESTKDTLMNLSQLAATYPCDYLLFIDTTKYTLPDEKVIQSIINEMPGEIWHAGLKKLHTPFPILYNYYQPTWLYNLDPENTIASTSWHLSSGCFLANTQILLPLLDPCKQYTSSRAFGSDIGYRMLKGGAIIRYEPSLAILKKYEADFDPIPLTDSCIFMQRHTGTKWYIWSLFRHLVNTLQFISILRSIVSTPKTNRLAPKQIARKPFTKPQEQEKPTISVFTPTLQRYTYLEEELKQLRNQTIPPVQIIITDQTDPELRDTSWLKKYDDLPILYTQQEEKGQCNAWNYCLENATGDYVLFLGDDADEIQPNFLKELYTTLTTFKADMVACNIKEDSTVYPYKQTDVFITDTFPICLVKKSVFEKSGGYDYAYNKGIRADADLAIRIHLTGALMVLNPNIKIHHHRAPVGGLRHHKQRQITNKMSRASITHFQLPAFSEIYLFNRFFSPLQVKEMLLLKKLSALAVKGGIGKQALKLMVAVVSYRSLHQKMKQVKANAKQLALAYPQIPKIQAHKKA